MANAVQRRPTRRSGPRPAPLRVAIVGLGMGRQHIPRYREDPACEVVALCDVDTARLEAAAREFAIPRTFTDAGELFASGLADVVSIATPNATHAPLTIAALDAGLHVLCEKPMALNAAQARRMLDAARRARRKIAIHFNHRMNGSIFTMRRYVESGDLGDPYFARTVWHRRRGIPGRPSFLDKTLSGGGAMIDLGVHMLDQTLFVLGYPRVRAVSAQTYTRFHQALVPDVPMDVDDFAVALIRFANGATLEMETSWASHHDHPETTLVQVYGTRAGLKRCCEDYRETQCAVFRMEHEALVSGSIERPRLKVPSVQADLLDAVRHDREPICSGQHGLAMMEILDAVYASSRRGGEVRLRA